jgi:hypothetical protein
MKPIRTSGRSWTTGYLWVRRRLAPLWRRNGGNAAVEFGLTVPILMILLAGGADYALLANNLLNLQAATRGAVEWAKANPPTSSTTVTCTTGSSGICTYGSFPSGASVTYGPVCICTDNSTQPSGTCPGSATCSLTDSRVIEYVSVSATLSNIQYWIPYSNLLLPSSVSASSWLRIQ